MTELSQSAYLSLSIRRAISAAQQRSHRYVTLEHLLLSLLDDPDAMALLEGVRADIAAIKVSAADTVNRNLATLYTPGEFDLRASYKVERVLQTASDDADRLNCQEVDAAFVLAAISRESDNPAADILTRNSFTYSAAMTWLYTNRGKSTVGRPAQKPAPAAIPADSSPASTAAPAESPAVPAREAPFDASSFSLEKRISDLVLEELGDVEPEPRAKPGRESPQAPPPAVAPRTAPTPAPAKPQAAAPPPVPAFDDDDENFYQDGKYSEPAQPQPSPQPRQRDAGEDGSGYAPTPAPQPVPRRAETHAPSSARLEQMRVRPAASRPRAPLTAPAPAPPQPVPVPQPAAKQARKRPPSASAPAPAPAKNGALDRAKGRAKTRRPGPYDALLGRLIENIPRRMCSAVPERIEVRISREDSVALGRGMEGRAETIRHDIMITQAMSVMLRAPDGGFVIEPLSPETQWIFERPETATDGETYGRWRWVVTPSETGQRRLQLIIAARSIDKNGLVGDTALPDQVITVRVRMNVLRSLGRGIQWLAAMILGGVLTELALIGMRIFEK